MAEDLPEIIVTPEGSPTPGDDGTGDNSTTDSHANPNRPVEEKRKYFPYLNRAVVVINGLLYYEWESVYVRLTKAEQPLNTFRFTCSEQEHGADRFSALRIIPGDKCTIWLDGELAITGEVTTRQVMYDANNHTVEISGAGMTGRMSEASVVSETGEYKNVNFQQLAQTATSHFGLGVEGAAQSNQKFPRVSVVPGESYWELLERYARAANTTLSESAYGDLQLSTSGAASVIEGKNILEGRERIHSLKAVGGTEPGASSPGAGSDFKTQGQAPGNDDQWGAQPTHQRQTETAGLTTAFSQGFLPKVANAEIPAWSMDMLKSRGQMERDVSDEWQINVTIVTLGWQRNGMVPMAGGLWRAGDQVTVNSPMLVMKNKTLDLTAVTFSQDNSTGTRSTLELKNKTEQFGKEPQDASAPDNAPGAGPDSGNQPIDSLDRTPGTPD